LTDVGACGLLGDRDFAIQHAQHQFIADERAAAIVTSQVIATTGSLRERNTCFQGHLSESPECKSCASGDSIPRSATPDYPTVLGFVLEQLTKAGDRIFSLNGFWGQADIPSAVWRSCAGGRWGWFLANAQVHAQVVLLFSLGIRTLRADLWRIRGTTHLDRDDSRDDPPQCDSRGRTRDSGA